MITDDQLTWLVTAGNIVIQFDSTRKRVAVGSPFAVEYSDGDWWVCCPQGKFRLCFGAPALFGRAGTAESLRWVSIPESFRNFVAFEEVEENTPIPERIPPQHADWLLGFLRHCVLVTVSDDPAIPLMPPESRATIVTKPGAALTKIKQLLRRRGSRRFQPRR